MPTTPEPGPVPLNRSLRGVPQGKRSMIFRAVERILRADPGLSAAGLRWQSFTGSAFDLAPVAPEICPLIRLSMAPRPLSYESTELYRLWVAIRIECFVAGTCQDDAADLWELVEDALRSGKETIGGLTVKAYLRNRAVVDGDGVAIASQGSNDQRFEDAGLARVPQISPDGVTETITMVLAAGTYVCTTTKQA